MANDQLDFFQSARGDDEEYVRTKLKGRVELEENEKMFPLNWHVVWYPDGVHRSIARGGSPERAWARSKRFLEEYGAPAG